MVVGGAVGGERMRCALASWTKDDADVQVPLSFSETNKHMAISEHNNTFGNIQAKPKPLCNMLQPVKALSCSHLAGKKASKIESKAFKIIKQHAVW